MDRSVNIPMRIGAWHLDPVLGQLSQGQEIVKVEARTMRLLICLAQRAGEVVSVDELLDQVWSGVIVTPDSVYQSVASLRRLLGDDPKQPRYIATVPRLGYRMIADVAPLSELPLAPVPQIKISEASPALSATLKRTRLTAVALLALLVIGALGLRVWLLKPTGFASGASIAVLPFLDLTTQEMNEEFFADGLTEELIDDLSKIPRFKVPSPTDVFIFKGKPLPVAEIARQLAVQFIIDGSVRKSNTTYRVATRLVRTADGYVMWTETYDRPLGDLVQVQKDVAAQVTLSVRASIEAQAAARTRS